MNSEIIKDQIGMNDRVLDTKGTGGQPCFKGALFEYNDDGFGNRIFTKIGENRVVLSGAIVALENLFGSVANFQVPTINYQLGINASETGVQGEDTVLAFMCGTGGSELEFGIVNEPDIKNKTLPGLVPLRSTGTLSGPEADQYFLKKQIGATTDYNYYAKTFDTTATPAGNNVVIKSLWKDSGAGVDGTEITSDVSGSSSTYGIEVFAEASLHMNENDVREYFLYNNNLNMARYNTLGLVSGQIVEVSPGYFDIVNARLFSQLNFQNRPLDISSDIYLFYRVYSMV